MTLKDIKNYILNWFIGFLLIIGFVCVVVGIIKAFTSTKGEKDVVPTATLQIDSLSIENDKLVIEINNLDSIKNAKTIEVKSLDNDSTLKLFYQLIGK